jgi:DNA-directed RNA polymerase alpha subunit
MEITLGQYIDAVNLIKEYHKQIEEKIYISKNEIIYIDNLDISFRLRNCLYDYFISMQNPINICEATTKDLLKVDINKFRNQKNVGKKSIEELLEIIHKIQTNTL